MINSSIKQRGFTLLETLIYIVSLLIILGSIVLFIYNLFNWYRYATIAPRVDQIGISTINRIANSIRGASTVNIASSVFNSPESIISVTETLGANSTTTMYKHHSGKMYYQLNSGPVTLLTPDDISISSFYVSKITTSKSDAVRIELNISYPSREGTKTNTYPSLNILRQSYK